MYRPDRRNINSPFRVPRRRGFTLVEILIALLIGVVAFYPIIQLFQSGIKDSMHATNWTQGRELAKSYTDSILSQKYDDLPHGGGSWTASFVVGSAANPLRFPKSDVIKGVQFKTTCQIFDLVPTFGNYSINRAGTETIDHLKLKNVLKGVIVKTTWKGVGKDLEYWVLTFKTNLFQGTNTVFER